MKAKSEADPVRSRRRVVDPGVPGALTPPSDSPRQYEPTYAEQELERVDAEARDLREALSRLATTPHTCDPCAMAEAMLYETSAGSGWVRDGAIEQATIDRNEYRRRLDTLALVVEGWLDNDLSVTRETLREAMLLARDPVDGPRLVAHRRSEQEREVMLAAHRRIRTAGQETHA